MSTGALSRQSFLDGTPFKVVGVLASISTVFLLVKEVLSLRGPAWSVVLAVFLVILAAASIIGIIFVMQRSSDALIDMQTRHVAEVRQHERDARVSVALPQIYEAFHLLHEGAISLAEGNTEEEFRNRLKGSLEELARAFSTLAGTPCRMSVKRLDFVGHDPATQGDDARFFEVKTFCRHDRLGDPPSITGPDRIVDNTDYRMLFEEATDERAFFCGDIHHEVGYVNSHMKERDPSTLNYRSNIVWPIESYVPNSNGSLGRRHHDIWGFLCVDSMAVNVFNPSTDVKLGAAYADILFTILRHTEEGSTRLTSTI